MQGVTPKFSYLVFLIKTTDSPLEAPPPSTTHLKPRSWLLLPGTLSPDTVGDASLPGYPARPPRSLTHLTPRNWLLSPGALSSDSLMRLRTWVMALTVAATNHGSPSTEVIPIRKASTNRSRWYP